MKLASTFWPHDECGCRREPIVGARYRRRSIDVLTGADRGWRHYTVVSVEPLRHDRIICRRAHLHGDDGTTARPQLQELFERFEAVENVTPFQRA